jgi:hypothetical protein
MRRLDKEPAFYRKPNRPGGEPDFAPSSETPGGYVGQAALEDGNSIGW